MTKETQEQCLALIIIYKKDDTNFDIRNQLFALLLPYLLKWLKSICRKKGLYYTSEELLSQAWESFIFCLKHYSNLEVPLPDHFFRCIGWFIQSEVAGLDITMTLSTYSKYQEAPSIIENYMSSGIISTDVFLTRFREYLPKDERIILDDILTGEEHIEGIPVNKYYAVKKAYKYLVKFFLEMV